MDGYPHTSIWMMAVPCQWRSAIFGSWPTPKKFLKNPRPRRVKTCGTPDTKWWFLFSLRRHDFTNYWKDPWGPQVFITQREQDIHYKDLKADDKFMPELYFLRCYQSSVPHSQKSLHFSGVHNWSCMHFEAIGLLRSVPLLSTICFVRRPLWIFLLWTARWVLTGAFSLWTDSERGKCKVPHPLLNNIPTWEASVRH